MITFSNLLKIKVFKEKKITILLKKKKKNRKS